MACDCKSFGNQLNLMNSKIDALLRENAALKTQQSNLKQEAFNFTRDWILGQGLESIALGVSGNAGFVTRINGMIYQGGQAVLSSIPNTVGEFLTKADVAKKSDLAISNTALEDLRRQASLADQKLEFAKARADELAKRTKALDDLKLSVDGFDAKLAREATARVRDLENQKSLLNQTSAIATRAENTAKGLGSKLDDIGKKYNGLLSQIDNKINGALKPITSRIDNVIANNKYLSGAINGIQGTLDYVSGVVNKLAPLLAVIGLLLSIASLAVSIGSIKVLGNRIDILERGLTQQGNSISQVLGILQGMKGKIDRLANVRPDLQVSFDNLAATVNRLSKDISIVSNNLKNASFVTASTVQSLINSAVSSVASIATAGAISAIISRFPRITNIPTSGTNTVRETTKIIERQPIIQPTVYRDTYRENNTFREIRTNTVNNNNTYREVQVNSGRNAQDIDYGRIQNIVRNEHQVTRGMLGGIRSRLNNSAPPILRTDINSSIQQATAPLYNNLLDIRRKTASLYQNQFVQSSMNTLNTAILVHNAMRLSFDAGTFITDSLGAVLNLTGIKFKDEGQNEITLSQAIGNTLEEAITTIIPVEWLDRTADVWIRSSSIFSSSANVLWAVRNIGDELQNVTEITNDRLGLWMNTARDERLVSFDAYPHQPPISTTSVYGRYNTFLEKVNLKTATFENTVSSIEDVAGSVGYIATVPLTVGEELNLIRENRDNIVNSVAPKQDEKEIEYQEQLLDNEAPETLDSPIPYSNSVE